MKGAYQPGLGLVLWAGLAAACGAPVESPAPGPPAGRWPLAVFLDSRGYELAGVDAGGDALATELGSDGARAVAVTPGGDLAPLLPAEPRSSRVLAAAPVGAVVEIASESGPELRLVDRPGTGRPVAVSPGARNRFLGGERDGSAIWTAEVREDGTETVFEHPWSGRPRRRLFESPRGFRAQVVAPGGRRAAVVAPVAPGSDQVVLVDLDRGERRLLLPIDREGRFRPLRFDVRGERLLVLVDTDDGAPRLEWIALANGQRAPALPPGCPPRAVSGDERWLFARLDCGGRATLVPFAPPSPWQDRLAEGLVPVAAARAGSGSWWLAVRSATSPRDLVRLDAEGALRPATWGLAPRLDPARIPRPEVVELELGGIRVPAEVWWPPTPTPRALMVWIEPGSEPPELGEHRPFHAFLASRGFATLRCALPTLERADTLPDDAADPDRRPELERAFRVGRRLLLERGGGRLAPSVLAVRGEGFARAALDLAASETSAATAIVVLDPGSGLRPQATASLPEPRVATLVVLDETAASTPELSSALEDRARRPQLVLRRRRPEAFAVAPGRAALRMVWEFLSKRLAQPR